MSKTFFPKDMGSDSTQPCKTSSLQPGETYARILIRSLKPQFWLNTTLLKFISNAMSSIDKIMGNNANQYCSFQFTNLGFKI